MQIKYWTNFSKRKNSTKQPTGGTQASAVLKERTGLNSPVFIFQSVPDSVKYINAFGRYYFVNEVAHVGGQIEVSCSSDPMATFKTEIGATYADVEYTSSSTNTDISDPRNRPTAVSDEVSKSLYDLVGMGFLNGYRYVVGILSDNGINYYLLDKTLLDNLVKDLFSNNFIQQLTSQFFDMKSCLVSCIAIPINRSTDLYDNVAIKISGIDISQTSETWSKIKDSKRILRHTVSMTALTFPSDAWGYDYSYLDLAPYTTASIYLPFVGVVPLDPDVFAQNKAIEIDIAVDICTGDIVYALHRQSGDIIATYQGNCAANIPIAGQSYNAIGVATGAIGVIGGIATSIAGFAAENPAAGLAGMGTAFGSGTAAALSLERHTQINGSLSSMIGLELGLSIKYCIQTRRPSELSIDSAFKAVSGMPYFKGATINTLSGYVKCNGASIDISGFDSDRDTINAYMNSGFYYE